MLLPRKTSFVLAWLLLLAARPAGAEPFQPAWRPAADLGGGVGGVVLGAFAVGGLAYFGTRLAGLKDVCQHDCLVPPTVSWGVGGAVLGGVAGVGFGTWAAGRLSGGNGALWATFTGEGVGLAAATMLALAGIGKNYEHVTFLILALAGAVVGYELSARSSSGDPLTGAQQQWPGAPPAVIPLWVSRSWF